MDFVVSFITLGIPFSTALLLAALGETVNQRAGIFNLGCEGIMAMGAFVGMLVPFAIGGSAELPLYVNLLGLAAAAATGALLGLLFGVVVITFGAPQGIAGIGMQLFGTGLAGTLFRHFVGGSRGISGIKDAAIPLLSDIPVLGKMFFRCNPIVYFAFLMVPVTHYILYTTPWGLRIRACGTSPRAADSIGIGVSRTRFEALAFGGAMAGLAGAYLSVCQAKMFTDTLISGRGFIAVALVYFGHWQPVRVMLGALLFSLAQSLQIAVQTYGLASFPYEFLVMLPYALVIVVLIFVRKSAQLGPAMLGKPFNREMRT